MSFGGGLEGLGIPVGAGGGGGGARGYNCRTDWEGSRRSFHRRGVGSSPQLSCARKESELICRHVSGAAEGKGKTLVDAVLVDELVSALLV